MTALTLAVFRWPIVVAAAAMFAVMVRALRRWDRRPRRTGPCGPVRLSEARRALLDVEAKRNGCECEWTHRPAHTDARRGWR